MSIEGILKFILWQHKCITVCMWRGVWLYCK